VAQSNKADGVNVTPITVVASIDPELLQNLIDMEEIDAESVDDFTDEIVMEYLESAQERTASVTGVRKGRSTGESDVCHVGEGILLCAL
jgi:hypothetical protein